MDQQALPIPSDLTRLRITGIIEGTSTLLLFFVAMPLKYGYGMDMAVRIVGSVHGFLFILYVVLALLAAHRYRWPWSRPMALSIAAVVPFGPFIMDPRIARWYRRDHGQEG